MESDFRLKKLLKNCGLYILESLSFVLNKNRPLDKTDIRKILVAESGGIGDLTMVFPAIDSLHANFPEASISVLVSSAVKEVLSLFPNRHIISDVIEYDLKGNHQGLLNKLCFILSLRKKRYDLTYSPDRGEGMREEVIMNFLMGARYRLGFKKGNVGLLNTVKIELRDDISILKQNLAILEAAGLNVVKDNIALNVSEISLIEAKSLLKTSGGNRKSPTITIHPGGAWNAKYKCWPIEKYISLIKTIAAETEARVVIVGSRNEVALAEKIVKAVNNPAVVSLSGKTTIVQMAAVIKLSHLFIGNDSGPLHLASAIGIPFIGLFGPTSTEQILSDTANGTLFSNMTSCSPCYVHQPLFKPRCNNYDHPKCMEMISVDKVYEAVRKINSSLPVNICE